MKIVGRVMDLLVCALAGIVIVVGFWFNIHLGIFLTLFVVLFHISRHYFFQEIIELKKEPYKIRKIKKGRKGK